MKTIALTLLILIALIGTGVAQVSQSSPSPAQHLTESQAAHLINTASTPEDHRELAQYFRKEAQRQREKEQYYREVATTYRLHPPRVDAYRNTSTADYYKQLADEAWGSALADDQKAVLQNKLAESVAQAK